MNLAEQITRAKADLDAVYEAGKASGGGDGFYDTFWDAYQNYGRRTAWNYSFDGYYWTDANYRPKYPIIVNTGFYMYLHSQISDTLVPIDFSGSSGGTTEMFGSCSNLKTVRTLTVTERTKFNLWFDKDTALENITFEGEIGNDIDFGSCTNLSRASIENIVSHLKFGVMSTVTFSETALKNAGWKQSNGGFDVMDWEAYFFVEAKGWEYALTP